MLRLPRRELPGAAVSAATGGRGLRFEITLSPRSARGPLVALILALASSELGSQSVTLTTYYPAPSGVYGQLITSGNTFIARDGGSAVIGTPNAPSYALEVVAASGDQAWFHGVPGGRGEIIVDNAGGGWRSVLAFAAAGVQQWQAGKDWDGTFFVLDAAHSRHALHTTAAGDLVFAPQGGFVGVRNASPASALDVGGDGVITSRQRVAQCRTVNYGGNGNPEIVSCGPGEYATNLIGVYSRYGSAGTNGIGTMYCCACPNSGCAALP